MSGVATCVDDNEWSYNSIDQSPCTVATALAGECVGGDFTLRPLQPGYKYIGPPAGTAATTCRCSSVYYSMLSACASCQRRQYVTWSEYKVNCTEVYLQGYPLPIPSGIAVPQWAYLDVSKGDNFNISRAQAVNGPESIGPGGATGLPSASGRSKVNAGAIAGGVIGGLVFIGLVGLAAFFLIRRRNKKKTPPSEVYQNAQPIGPSISTTAYSAVPLTYTPDGYDPLSTSPAPKVYDPNDPSTWPTNQGSFPQSQTTGSTVPQNYGQPYPNDNSGYLPNVSTGNSGSTGLPQPQTGYLQPQTGYTQPNQGAAPIGRYTGVAEL